MILVLTESGKLYGWGSNKYSMLSQKQGDYKSKPTPILVPPTSPIKQVSAGSCFACILLENGQVCCWGNNAKCQCGLERVTSNNVEIIPFPTVVLGVEDVVAISCGSDHTLCLTNHGSLIVFGSNEHGQLGLPSSTHFTTPVEVPLPCKIVKIAAGMQHSVVLDETGAVYTAGSYGNNSLFQFCEMMTVKDGCEALYAGNNTSLVVTSDKKVYMWGQSFMDSNLYYALPQEAVLPRFNSLRVSLGMTHSCLYLSEYQTDLTTSVFNLSPAESAVLTGWDPSKVIREFSSNLSSLSVFESVSLMLAYLTRSNRIFFENQNAEKYPDTPNCFVMRVTSKSVAQNLDLISNLLQMYFDTYIAKAGPMASRSAAHRKRSMSESAPSASDRLVRPPSKSFSTSSHSRKSRSGSLSRSGSVNDDGQDLPGMNINEDDFEMDENELLQVDMDGYKTVDYKHQAKRSHAIDMSFENKDVLRTLYYSIELLYAQQLYYFHSKSADVLPVFSVDSLNPTDLLTLLFKILEIDSNSVEISLIKKKVNDVICNLMTDISNITPFFCLIDMIFSEYERVQNDPKLDHFSLLDTVLALLKYLKKSNLIENLVSKDKCNSFVLMLKQVFSHFSDIFSSYIRVLSSDQHDLDVSGLTDIIHFILQLMSSMYNNDFRKVYKRDESALESLKTDGTNIINICSCVLEFSQKILGCFVETVTLEKDISKQLSDFYTSSPVYQDIEFILYICYSIVLHYSNIDQSISEKVSAIVQESMKSVCVLLKPLSQIAILQNQCINLFESHKSIRIRRSECIP